MRTAAISGRRRLKVATFSDLIVTRWGARFMGCWMPCAVGRGGIGQKRGEGDGITPEGVFDILGVYSRPDRGLADGTLIQTDHVWSDDPDDPAYNTLQKGWPYAYSAERMRRADPLYDLVADLSYNRAPILSGKGSAIFLHIWRKPRHPTQGCVAFARKDLVFVLENWAARSRVIIRA